MGKKNRKSRAKAVDVTSDDDSMSSASTGWSEQSVYAHEVEQNNSLELELENHVDALYEKRGATREKALSGLVAAFENNVLTEFVDNKSITLLQNFVNSVKRGSAKEASLASRALGLLAITIGSGGNAHEILEEAVQHLYQALKSGSDPLKKSAVVDGLAVITFVGADDVTETERSMRFIWELIHPKSAANVTLTKPNPAVLSSALSAWAFLLTTINQWRNNSTNWQDSISFLSNLLDKDDRSVRIAAGEALALIFEKNKLEKFAKVDFTDSNGSEHGKPDTGLAYADSLKSKFLNQARNLSMEAGGKGSAKTDLHGQRNLFQRILSFIETGEFDEISMKVLNNCSPLMLSSWAQLIQLNFLKRFLASGYLKHMTDNAVLHEIFDYIPKKRENLSVKEKRMYMSRNSVSNKERTQYLNKRRTWAQDRNRGQFAVGYEDN